MTGLTMVGIHERSGREKISTSKVAHIMNNELERKYLTSIKRLMTYAQTKRTDIAPSMKMLNK
jgi:pre-mRNA-splicing factor 18